MEAIIGAECNHVAHSCHAKIVNRKKEKIFRRQIMHHEFFEMIFF